jgi:NADPH:quinone reductase-like Zn-dependent oxidoreductase
MPDQMSFDDGAALPVNYLTAYHMVYRIARVSPGEKLLIHMAAGGVGQALIQLSRLIPNVTLFGTASAEKHAQLKEAGIDHPIDYRRQDYAEEIRRLTDGRGVNVIFDPLGGKDWTKGYNLLRAGGHLIAFGWANIISGTHRDMLHALAQWIQMKRYSPYKLMGDNKTVSGVKIGHLWNERDQIVAEMDELVRLYREGKIRPRIDKVFPLAAGGDAHNYVQQRKNVGKVLFDCSAA